MQHKQFKSKGGRGQKLFLVRSLLVDVTFVKGMKLKINKFFVFFFFQPVPGNRKTLGSARYLLDCLLRGTWGRGGARVVSARQW